MTNHSQLSTLIRRHLALPVEHLSRELPLVRQGLDRHGLLNLVAAIDLEMAVYVSPSKLWEGLNLSQLAELVSLPA